jgi:hypothetical protein
LTGTLTCSGGKSGIVVNAVGVTIDLNGFTIVGGGAGTFGINVPNSAIGQTLVENGIVSGFATGISLQSDSVVKNIRAAFSSNTGIAMSSNGSIEDCIANDNNQSGGGIGISCGGGCNISGNTASSDSVGISSGGASLILRNTIDSDVTGLSITSPTTGYGENILSFNPTNVSGGTSLKNNVCSGVLC